MDRCDKHLWGVKAARWKVKGEGELTLWIGATLLGDREADGGASNVNEMETEREMNDGEEKGVRRERKYVEGVLGQSNSWGYSRIEKKEESIS